MSAQARFLETTSLRLQFVILLLQDLHLFLLKIAFSNSFIVLIVKNVGYLTVLCDTGSKQTVFHVIRWKYIFLFMISILVQVWYDCRETAVLILLYEFLLFNYLSMIFRGSGSEIVVDFLHLAIVPFSFYSIFWCACTASFLIDQRFIFANFFCWWITVLFGNTDSKSGSFFLIFPNAFACFNLIVSFFEIHQKINCREAW